MRQDRTKVRGYAVTHPAGVVRLPTQPGWDQVIYARSGVFVARTDRERWTVLPYRALCIGDGTQVQVETRRSAAIRCLYLRADLGALEEPIRVVTVSTLTRELLLHAVDVSPLELSTPVEQAAVTLLVDRLRADRTAELQLPVPVDHRARQLTDAILANPSLALADAVRPVAAGRRTLERLVRAETGLTLAGWRRRSRVLLAVEMLAGGRSVTRVAADVGYASPSSFVAAFRAELGRSPRAFFTTPV